MPSPARKKKKRMMKAFSVERRAHIDPSLSFSSSVLCDLHSFPTRRSSDLSIVNVYFYGEPSAGDRSWVLIDAGLGFSRRAILDAAADRFGRHARPAIAQIGRAHV